MAILMAQGVHRGLWALFMMMPLGAAAAFNLPALGGATIGITDLAAVVVFLMVVLTRGAGASTFGTIRAYQPGFFFAGVMIVAAFSAIFFPVFFTGETEVFGISRNENSPGIVRIPLGFSTGNITQLFRLTLGFILFLALATAFRRRPDARAVLRAMIAATVLNFVLGWVDVLTYTTGTALLLDPIRTANYSMHITDTMAGFKRMVGGFPEASSFGVFSLALFGFWLQYVVRAGAGRAGPWMLALATISVLRSTSSAAYLALVVFVVGFTLFYLLRVLRPRADRRTMSFVLIMALILWLGGLAIAAGYGLVEQVTEFLDRVLFKKLSSDSGVERMSWNAQAMQNFRDTWGLGAGLGSVRASNWLVACLGSIGVLGTLLYLGFLGALARMPETRPNGTDHPPHGAVILALKSAIFALLVSAVLTLATPDLGLPFFALAGLATGLSRALATDSV